MVEAPSLIKHMHHSRCIVVELYCGTERMYPAKGISLVTHMEYVRMHDPRHDHGIDYLDYIHRIICRSRTTT